VSEPFPTFSSTRYFCFVELNVNFVTVEQHEMRFKASIQNTIVFTSEHS